MYLGVFFFSSRRRHTRCYRDWSSDVCSSDLVGEAAGLIHQAGGVASLAHPTKIKRGQPLLFADDLRPLIKEGFDAVEAWQWIPGGWGSRHYLGVAGALGILVSGGSDDHGKRAADGAMRLGAQPVPPEVLEALRERALALRPG